LLFFSASKSKLIPYVLPVFPPLAWIMGRAIAELRTKGDPVSWRGPLRVSATLAALLGTGLLVVVLKPGLIKSPEQLLQLRPLVWPAALALLAGGFVCWRLARCNQPGAALTAILAASGVLYATLVRASPVVAHPSTKSLAEIVTREAAADALVLHYHEFFHDFTYYASRTAGTVAAESELEIFLDAEAQHSGLFIAEADLQNLWAGPRRIFLVSRRRELTTLQQQPWFHAKVVGETPSHVLFSNHD
jgi:4-amino-4-deoxy-L-arabinose transferase-like glycosyltransferase